MWISSIQGIIVWKIANFTFQIKHCNMNGEINAPITWLWEVTISR